MLDWSLLATRNWRVKPVRTAGTIIAVALGVGTVVWVTCSYESVRRSISDQIINRWVGRSHLSVESPLGHWGHVAQSVADIVASLDTVTKVTSRLNRRMNLVIGPHMRIPTHEDFIGDAYSLTVDVIGIQPASEYAFRTLEVQGRVIQPDDRWVAIVEAKTAAELGIGIGDPFTIESFRDGPARTFEVIGLYEARRIAKFQKPMVYVNLPDLQEFTGDRGRVTIVDAMLADAGRENLERSADALRTILARDRLPYQVTTSTARLTQLTEAQRQTEFALLLVASVALLTAFFIIMTTMSMGMSERVQQLGMLRCVGATRLQLAALVLFEAAPLGAVGVLLGIPVGLGLTRLGTVIAPEYVQELAVNVRGIVLAVIGGALTTLGSAVIPVFQAVRTSPLAATRPQAKPPGILLPFVAAAAGAGCLLIHNWMVRNVSVTDWCTPAVGTTATALIYVGCALMTPLIVRVGGGLMVHLVARVLALKPRLLNDQVGRAAWRGAGICCGLMVGLSLLISVVVYAESVRVGWDFPKRLGEALVWTRQPLWSGYADVVRGVPGVAECTVVNEIRCDIGQGRSGFFDLFKLKSTFVAGEAERFLNMTKLEFLEGSFDDAYNKMRAGGYILLPHEASRAFGLHLGDRVPITAAGRTAVFEVAGVVQSPALDIAVTYFQADTYLMMASAGSVLGTLDDAKKHFGIDELSMLLMNFDPPEGSPPPLFASKVPPVVTTEFVARAIVDSGEQLNKDPEATELLRRRLIPWLENPDQPFDSPFLLAPYRGAFEYAAERWEDRDPYQRWQMFFDQLVMRRVVQTIDRPEAIFGSLRELKQQIDDDIREATLLLAAIPVVALFVAAIGVGNLMTANVISRSREIAILRSAGSTQWQIMRLVLGEAMVLGGIGSAVGLGLGVYAAWSVNELTLRAIGFAPSFHMPWRDIVVGIALTVTVCIIAGLSPARRACRTNIIDAMRAV